MGNYIRDINGNYIWVDDSGKQKQVTNEGTIASNAGTKKQAVARLAASLKLKERKKAEERESFNTRNEVGKMVVTGVHLDPVTKEIIADESFDRTRVGGGGLSGYDPLLGTAVEWTVGGKMLGDIWKGVQYGLGRYGTPAIKNWARGRLIGQELNRAPILVPAVEETYLNIGKTPVLNFTTAKSNVGSTSLAFYQRPTSRITLAERLGIPKGDRGNLNQFQKDALEDLNLYINSGLYRQFPTINMDTGEPFWGTRGNPPAILLLVEDGVPSVRGRGREWLWNRPNGGTYELVTDGNGNFGIGYNSYRMFDISPEFNIRVGEAYAGAAKNGYSKIFLTAPRNEAIHLITETPEQELAKKVLIETLSPRINKDIMRDFWSGVQLSLRPGAYLSGDEGMLPKGATLIRQFKKLHEKAYRRDNNRNIIGSARTNWEDIKNSLMRTEKWKKRGDGLSTDSYLALLKQANRKNSPYSLRYSPDGFTTFNGQSIDNKFISDLLEKVKRGESTQQEFLDAFHKWVSPYGGMDAKIVNGKIIIPHPFLYKKKQGGKFKYYIPKHQTGGKTFIGGE